MSPLPLFSFAACGNVARFLMVADQPQNKDFIVSQDADEFRQVVGRPSSEGDASSEVVTAARLAGYRNP